MRVTSRFNPGEQDPDMWVSGPERISVPVSAIVLYIGDTSEIYATENFDSHRDKKYCKLHCLCLWNGHVGTIHRLNLSQIPETKAC